MQTDPLGYATGDPDLYNYVGNAPVSAVDPLGLYDDDVHYYMTYFIAGMIGLNCKTCLKINGRDASAGFAISWADAYTDYNENTQPMGVGSAAVDRRRRFHFRTPAGGVEAGSSYAKEIAELGVKKCDPLLTGIGLHILQDSYSHETYSPVSGHARIISGKPHSVDDPSEDVEKALVMARMTLNILVKYGKDCCKQESAKEWNPAKEWKRVSGVIEEMFTAGIKEQSLSYEDQVRRRVSRWRELVVYAFRYSNTEPCVSKFQDAASQVGPPKEEK